MSNFRLEVLQALTKYEGQKVAVAWSGGAFSTLIWYLVLLDTGVKLPLIFVDTDKHPIALYSHIKAVERKLGIYAKRIFTTNHDDIDFSLREESKNWDVILTGRPKDYGVCPLPDNEREIWNLIKTIRAPFYTPVNKSFIK